MRRQLFGTTIVLALALGGPDSSAQSPNLRSIMREKLTNAQQLLEGVVTANFTIVDNSADRLAQISSEGGDAALARHVVAEHRDLADRTCGGLTVDDASD